MQKIGQSEGLLQPGKQESSIEGKDKIPWHTKSSEEILELYQIDAL